MGDRSKFRIPGYVNALRMFEWDGVKIPNLKLQEHPTPERLLQYLCTPGLDWKMPAFKTRYGEVGAEPTVMAFSIEEPELRENVFWPLRHAKTSYLTGNYVGAIALCGLVAEKLAILLFELNSSEEHEKAEFIRLGQANRVKRLKALALISPETVSDFGVILGARKRYLHLWTPASNRSTNDAVQCYRSATRLVVGILQLGFGAGDLAGTITINPRLVEYLRRRGAIDEGDHG